ncbi:arabinose efflux permease family protein [Mycobacterium sp. JS623]|uniref:MFS transporter n=1 Tax=Mycobacterium sp. JS623 TaxID=212767 RepID=UPI0002A55272|nr:MFS transporter [Mycobacterium sp. JS623]AGB25112.1 arabinose efflux permease family protein [Mycobacterium sp. JS623]
MTLTAERVPTEGLRESLPGLLSLALASFLAVTTEVSMVGLLPDVGANFRVSDSVTGLLVSLYAVMVAALAVPLTLATARFGRKPLLLTTLLGYALSNALVAAAPVFIVVAIGRAIGGTTHALFFSLMIGYAPRLVSRAQVGRALALAGGGASAGMVLGVPLATSVGTAAGWRVSFSMLAALSILTFMLVSRLLPSVGHEPAAGGSIRAGRRALTAVSASNLFAFLGQFTVYTFVSVLLLSSGVSPAFVGPILLACGACGLISLWWVGRHLDQRPRRAAVVVLTIVIGAVVVLGSTWPSLVAVIVATAVWNGAFGGLPSIYQACAVRTHAVSPELAGAWVNATANAGIAGGSAIGAGLLQVAGLSSLPWVGALLIGVGLALVILSRKAFPAKA